MTQRRILVVDDEAPMRKLLATNLKASGYDVSAAADGAEALDLLEHHPFDLLLLDLTLPGPGGLRILETVRRNGQMPVMIVSARGQETDKVTALNTGADDYLVKPFGMGELIARANALLRRAPLRKAGQHPTYRYSGLEIDFIGRRAHLHGSQVLLTRREFDILALLARNAPKVVLQPQILQAVWGGEFGEQSDYVWTFVRRIRAKIEPTQGAPRYVLTEPGIGYRMPVPDAETA